MGLSTLTSRVPGAIRNRLPSRLGGQQDAPTETTPDVSPDEQVGTPDTESEPDAAGESGSGSSLGEKLRKGTTLLTFAGLGLAALGALGRALIDRRSSDDDVEQTEPEEAIEVDAATIEADEVTVETEREGSVETELAEHAEADTDSDVSGAGATSTEEPTRLSRARATTAEYPRIAPLVGMVALVGMKLFVDRFDGEVVRS